MHCAAGGILSQRQAGDRGGDEQNRGNGGDGVESDRRAAREGMIVDEGFDALLKQGPCGDAQAFHDLSSPAGSHFRNVTDPPKVSFFAEALSPFRRSPMGKGHLSD
jgi:hypothetical protein